MILNINIKKVLLFSLLSVLPAAFTVQAAPFSEFWKQDDNGAWYVEKPDGERVRNAWLCDDAVTENGREIWYLIDKDGYMTESPLVKDGTGNCYSVETGHDGYYGMLRNRSGIYGGISLNIEERHEGSFAAILNEDGITALTEAYGMTGVPEIDNSNCVYTSTFYETVKAADDGPEESGGTVTEPASEKVKASLVDEDLCAEYFIRYLNDYRMSLGLQALETDDSRMSYAKERAYRDSVSHKGNTARYEICSIHGVMPSEYEGISPEEAAAGNALKFFKASASHNAIMKLETLRSAGAGFHIVEDRSDGSFNFYCCEANFE